MHSSMRPPKATMSAREVTITPGAVSDEQFAKLAEVLGECFARQHLAGKLDRIVEKVDALTAEVARLSKRVPVLLTVEAAAEAMKVSPRTMRRWVTNRQIPFVRIGGKTRIDLTAMRSTDDAR